MTTNDKPSKNDFNATIGNTVLADALLRIIKQQFKTIKNEY